jgi:hypothetical protein
MILNSMLTGRTIFQCMKKLHHHGMSITIPVMLGFLLVALI